MAPGFLQPFHEQQLYLYSLKKSCFLKEEGRNGWWSANQVSPFLLSSEGANLLGNGLDEAQKLII